MRKVRKLGATALFICLAGYAVPSFGQGYSAWALCWTYSPVDSTLYMTGIFRSDKNPVELQMKFFDIVGHITGIGHVTGTICEKRDDGNELNSLRYDIKQNHRGDRFRELPPPR